MLIAIVFLSISLSLDALGVSISYGIKNVKISFLPKAMLFISSMICSYIGVFSGSVVLRGLGMQSAKTIGIACMIVIGIWMITKSQSKEENIENRIKNLEAKEKKLLEFAIKSIGITIMIIKNPAKGDIDNSGRIDLKEAFMLGIALNVDAAMGCMGSVMAGLSSAFMPIFIASAQVICIQFGEWLGKKISRAEMFNDKIVSFIPGAVLIALGIIKIFI
ncbi:MAG: manganese efflux pump [Deltaproteobacteria bacterium]